MKKQLLPAVLMILSILASGCSSAAVTSGATESIASEESAGAYNSGAESTVSTEPSGKDPSEMFSARDFEVGYDESESAMITLNSNSATSNSDAVQISGSTVTIVDEGTYILSGTLNNGMIIVDSEKTDKTHLILNGVTIHSETSAPLYILQSDKVFITTAEGTVNTLSNGGTFTAIDENKIDSVIFSKEDLTLNGSGTLVITSPAGHGIVSKDSLTLTGGSYDINCASHALAGKDDVCIADGNFTIVSGKDGINAAGGSDSSGAGGRDGAFGRGMSASNGSITISGGTINITAYGDGIDANGSLDITGGYTTVCGPTQGDTATLDYDSRATITGGTFVGSGASGMAQTFSESEQGVIALRVGDQSAGTTAKLTNRAGDTVITYTPGLSFAVIILSSPDLVKGETYTLTVGSDTEEITAG